MGFPAQKKTQRCAHVHPHTVDIDRAVGSFIRALGHAQVCFTAQRRIRGADGRHRGEGGPWVGGWGGDTHRNRLRLKCVKNCPLRVGHKYFFPQRKPGNADASLKAGESPSALSEQAGSLPGSDITPPPCPRSTTTPTR